MCLLAIYISSSVIDACIFCDNCISFPVAAITNDHKLGGLEQQKFILSHSGGQKLKISVIGQKSRSQQGCSPSGDSKGKNIPCLFKFLWHQVDHSDLQDHLFQIALCSIFILSYFLSACKIPLPSFCKDTCECI